MHCDHFVSSENLLNQNVSVCQKSVIDLVEVKWRVKIRNLPNQFYTRWKLVKTQLCVLCTILIIIAAHTVSNFYDFIPNFMSGGQS